MRIIVAHDTVAMVTVIDHTAQYSSALLTLTKGQSMRVSIVSVDSILHLTSRLVEYCVDQLHAHISEI